MTALLQSTAHEHVEAKSTIKARRDATTWNKVMPETDTAVSDELRRVIRLVALLNLAYFGIEFVVARAIGSVSLFADSIDFLEDASINALILAALQWSPVQRARVGMALAGILLAPGDRNAVDGMGHTRCLSRWLPLHSCLLVSARSQRTCPGRSCWPATVIIREA